LVGLVVDQGWSRGISVAPFRRRSHTIVSCVARHYVLRYAIYLPSMQVTLLSQSTKFL